MRVNDERQMLEIGARIRIRAAAERTATPSMRSLSPRIDSVLSERIDCEVVSSDGKSRTEWNGSGHTHTNHTTMETTVLL